MKNITCIILGFLCHVGMAQNHLDLASIGQKFTSPTEFENIPKEASELNYYGDISLPIKLKDSLYFLTGISYKYFKTDLDTTDLTTTFQSIVLKLGLNKTFNNNWGATCLLLPRLSTDFDNVNIEDFQIGIALIATKKHNPNLHYKLGLFYNQDLYGPYLTPIAGVYRQSKNEKFIIDLLLPSKGSIYYKLHKHFITGFRFNSTTASYKLYNELTGTETYLHQRNNDAKVVGQILASDNFIIELLFGHTISKKYEMYNPDDKIDLGFISFLFGDSRDQLNANIKDGLVREFRLIYRIPTDLE